MKAEHRHPSGLLQPHEISEWKWDAISMDFIVGLPLSSRHHDAILVTIDTLTKVSHFSPVCTTYTARNVTQVFLRDIVRLHVIPRKIISNQDSLFTLSFWRELQSALGTRLNFSTAYHPETDG